MKQCPSCSRFYDDPDAVHCGTCDGVALTIVTDVSEADAADPLLGTLVDGRFEVKRCLGAGGMGAVYEAVQTSVERRVALKVIRGKVTKEAAKRFLLEARLTSSLRNVHTVTLHDFGSHGDQLYLAMELLEGRPLEDVLDAEGALPWQTAVHVVGQVARSLEEAHSKGIVHRDLKPANIFVTAMSGDPWFVKVLDFGIGKLVASDESMTALTGTGAVIGTPAYMSPEQAQARSLDGRTDLYSLGCVLFELLTGARPYTAESAMQVLMKHCTAPTPPLDDLTETLPDDVHALVHALMQKKPEDRPANAREVAEWAEACLRADGPPSPPVIVLEPVDATHNGDLRRSLAADTYDSALQGTARADAVASLVEEVAPSSSNRWLAIGAAVLLGGALTLALLIGQSQDGTAESTTRGSAASAAKASPAAPTSPGSAGSSAAPGTGADVIEPATTVDSDAEPGAAGEGIEEPRTEDAGPGSHADTPPAAEAPTTVTIGSSPAGARIVRCEGAAPLPCTGEYLGDTPHSVHSAGAHEYGLQLDGHQEVRVSVDNGQTGDVIVDLPPSAPPPKRTPRRAKPRPSKERGLIGY